MNYDIADLAENLGALLETENRLLRQHQFPDVAVLVKQKDALLNGLTQACLKATASAREGALSPLGEKLRRLAAENHRLLDQAIKTQGQVIQIVAQAASARPESDYGRLDAARKRSRIAGLAGASVQASATAG
jgi:flagellar biosynthesis/type III secretory pathway chaperone